MIGKIIQTLLLLSSIPLSFWFTWPMALEVTGGKPWLVLVMASPIVVPVLVIGLIDIWKKT